MFAIKKTCSITGFSMILAKTYQSETTARVAAILKGIDYEVICVRD